MTNIGKVGILFSEEKREGDAKMFFSEWRLKESNSAESKTIASVMISSCGEEYCRHDKEKVVHCNSSPYSVHLVLYGKGRFRFDGGEPVELGKGDLFLQYEGGDYEYKPVESSPWAYSWVNFGGENLPQLLSMCGFSREKPYIHTAHFDRILPIFKEITESCYDNENVPANCLGMFMKLTGILMEEQKNNVAGRVDNRKKKTLNRVIMYINDNIKLRLTIPLISESVMLSESYVKNIFVENLGMSVTEYVNRYRVSLACVLLKEKKEERISDIAQEVGYYLVPYFVRVFKKYKGVGPLQYRKYAVEKDPFDWYKEKKLDNI